MSYLSSRFLWKTAAYVAIGGMTAVMLMRSVLKDRVRQAEYFRESMRLLRAHEGANFVLGPPIKEVGLDISDPNVAGRYEAYFEIKVRGNKNRGIMYFWANREHSENSPWNVERIELEVKGEEGKRLVVKKPENETENSSI